MVSIAFVRSSTKNGPTWNRIVHDGKLFMSGWNFLSILLAFLRFIHPSVIHSFPKEFYDKHTEFRVGCICFLSYCHVTYRMVLPFAMCVRNSTESVCALCWLYWKMYGPVAKAIISQRQTVQQASSRGISAKWFSTLFHLKWKRLEIILAEATLDYSFEIWFMTMAIVQIACCQFNILSTSKQYNTI